MNAPRPEAEDEAVEEEVTQIGRALRELGIGWITAHSPQAKDRIERFFGTAQDRLVKGLRLAKVSSLEGANAYLEQEYLPLWNQGFTLVAASTVDAHRALSREHNLPAILSQVEERVVTHDYTIRYQGKIYQIARGDIRAGCEGGVRVEPGGEVSRALPEHGGVPAPAQDASTFQAGEYDKASSEGRPPPG